MLVPTVVRLTSHAPKDPLTGWEGYWRGIHSTGRSGEVLWDSGSLTEALQYADAIVAHFDPTLPVIDVGCGNGTYTRWLAKTFPHVTGIDVSQSAVDLAKKESAGLNNIDFLAVDATQIGAGDALLKQMGPSNIFVRGVLHVLKPDKQARLADNLRVLVKSTGRVFLTETNFPGNSLAYMQELGATRQNIAPPLRSALENLPRPGHFGAQERGRAFPSAQWKLITDGPVSIEVVPMNSHDLRQQVPGYFAVLTGS